MKTYRITVNGNPYDVTVEETNGQAPIAATETPRTPNVSSEMLSGTSRTPSPTANAPAKTEAPKQETPKPSSGTGSVKVNSPLPGSIFKVPVKVGENVKKGQVIIVIEAMKMENEILAPSDGTISSIEISEGSSINTGDLLLTMND